MTGNCISVPQEEQVLLWSELTPVLQHLWSRPVPAALTCCAMCGAQCAELGNLKYILNSQKKELVFRSQKEGEVFCFQKVKRPGRRACGLSVSCLSGV